MRSVLSDVSSLLRFGVSVFYLAFVSRLQDGDRLVAMGYQKKIELATAKIGAKFIDYRPETGSWVFEVRTISCLKLTVVF